MFHGFLLHFIFSIFLTGFTYWMYIVASLYNKSYFPSLLLHTIIGTVTATVTILLQSMMLSSEWLCDSAPPLELVDAIQKFYCKCTRPPFPPTQKKKA